MSAKSSFGLLRVKVVSLAVANAARADQFYGGTLGLAPAIEGGRQIGFQLENSVLMLKPAADWYGRPTAELNARITLEVLDARETERILRTLGVTISDPVADYDGFPVGAFLDSEGNKLWFCSEP
jgi:hypothetical protein